MQAAHIRPVTAFRHLYWFAALLLIPGCTSSSSIDCVSADVMHGWKHRGSYYALLEIVETVIDPGVGTMRKEQVQALLGKPDELYPNAAANSGLVYSSSRVLPYGSYLFLSFDDRGILRGYDWGSE
jgi:hypothetical protein